jgi:murein DD-endopeptidase MepM/ murein hydrolase activator NlpD
MVAAWLAVGTANMVGSTATPADAELARMTAQVQALKAGSSALQGTVQSTAERIEARQKFLDALLAGKADRLAHAADLLPAPARAARPDTAEAGVLAPFAALEARQLALVDRAAATAETRLRDAEALIGRLGLHPSRFLAQSSSSNLGRGGPFIPAGALATSGTSAGPDPRFADLFVNWQRVEQLQDAMQAIPAYIPVRNYTLTSNFGFRYDPFHGGSATHAGLDMAGATGEPVMAAAGGTVVRAGWFGAYGNAIDVDHGKGIITRYGHLSRIYVKQGEKVAIGEKIGAIGSTGRSTGPHLHYEVRIDGRAVDPRRFLEASDYLIAYQKQVGPQQPS